MPIFGKKKIDTGAYMGYTQGSGPNQKPTLYFENGHFTQHHKDLENIGWHPNKSKHHVMLNIYPHLEPEIRPVYGAEAYNIDAIRGHIQIILSNFFKVKEIEDLDNDENPFLLEYDLNDSGTPFYAHPSRGVLILKEDVGFNPKYNATYASNLMKEAVPAPNEKNKD